MEILNKMLEMWHLKTLLGIMLIIFSPVKVSIIIIFIMIILDTITGTICGVKLRQISSNRFKKSIKKILIYCTSIITVRLVEFGAFSQEETYILTEIISGFLIATEGISIIENLTILGLPLPKNFLKVLIWRLKSGIVEDILDENDKDQKLYDDILNMLKYHVPIINSEITRGFLNIYINTWLKITKEIVNIVNELNKMDNDLMYYRTISIINLSISQFKREIKECSEFKNCTCLYKILNEINTDDLLYNIKNICYNNTAIEDKKQNITKSITIFLYKMIIEVQKYEHQVCNIK